MRWQGKYCRRRIEEDMWTDLLAEQDQDFTHTNMVWSASWLQFCCCVKMSWSLLRLALYCSNSVLLQVSICLYIKVICHQPLMRSIFNRSIFSWWKSQLTSITLIISILFICSVLTRVFIILLEISILSLNVYILSQILDNVKLWYDIILSFPGFKGCITVKRCPFLNQSVLGQFFLFFLHLSPCVGSCGKCWVPVNTLIQECGLDLLSLESLMR